MDRSRWNAVIGDGVSVQHPYAGMSAKQVRDRIDATAVSARDQLEELSGRLRASILRHHGLDVLAHFAYYGLCSTQGTNDREFREADPVHQFYVELLQAVALCHKPSQFANEHLRFGDASEIFEAIRSFARAADEARGHGNPREGETSSSLAVVEAARAETQAVRMPGFPHITVDILTSLFKPLEKDLECACGLRVEGVIAVWQFISRSVEERLTAHMHRCRPFSRAARSRDLEGALSAFLEAFPDPHPELRDLVRRVGAEDPDGGFIEGFFLSFADVDLWRCFVVELDACDAAYAAAVQPALTPAPPGASPDTVNRQSVAPFLARALHAWAIEFGELEAIDPTRFVLDNPVWQRPLVRLADDAWLCFLPTLFLSFPFELVETLLLLGAEQTSATVSTPGYRKPRHSLRARYEKRRADFLEEEIAQLFSQRLPGATIIRHTVWIDSKSGRRYENDILVVVDSHVLVIEAKSGAVSMAARRGAPGRLRKTISEIVEDASRQADRCSRYVSQLAASNRIADLRTANGSRQNVELPSRPRCIPLVITLDHLNLGGLGGRSLFDAGWIAADVACTPVLNLWDLRAVLDVLERPADILHYFARRVRFERTVRYQAFEMDLLGHYLDHGLGLEHTEKIVGRAYDGSMPVIMLGYSRLVAPFLGSATLGHRVAKLCRPEPRRSTWFNALIDALEQRRPASWTSISEALIATPVEAQEALEEAFLLFRERSAVDSLTMPQHPALVFDHDDYRSVIVAIDLPQETKETQRAAFIDGAHWAAENYEGSLVIAIGLPPGYPTPEHPYALIGLVHPDVDR